MFMRKLIEFLEEPVQGSDKYKLSVGDCFYLEVYYERDTRILKICPNSFYVRCSLGEFEGDFTLDDVLYFLGVLSAIFAGYDIEENRQRKLFFWKHRDNWYLGIKRSAGCSFVVYEDTFIYHVFFKLYMYLFSLLPHEVVYKDFLFTYEGFFFRGYFVSWSRVYLDEVLSFFSPFGFVDSLFYGSFGMERYEDRLLVRFEDVSESYSLLDYFVLGNLFIYFLGGLR